MDSNQDWALRNLQSQLEQTRRDLEDVTRLIRAYAPTQVSAFDLGGNPYQFEALMRPAGSWAGIVVTSGWPWEVHDTTTGSTGQVQVNGGDGSLAALNGFVSNVSGNPTNVTPYPQVTVTGNGYIYAKATPTTAGTASPLASLDITFQTSVQEQDTANPAAFYWMLLATITNYATDGSGNVSFTLANQYGSGYGPSTIYYCLNGALAVY